MIRNLIETHIICACPEGNKISVRFQTLNPVPTSSSLFSVSTEQLQILIIKFHWLSSGIQYYRSEFPLPASEQCFYCPKYIAQCTVYSVSVVQSALLSVQCFYCPKYLAIWPVYSISISLSALLSVQCFYCPKYLAIWPVYSVSIALSVRLSGQCRVFLLSWVPGSVASGQCTMFLLSQMTDSVASVQCFIVLVSGSVASVQCFCCPKYPAWCPV
jgi:hypothetical protein